MHSFFILFKLVYKITVYFGEKIGIKKLKILILSFFLLFSYATRPAATIATGTRNGEQETVFIPILLKNLID